MELRASILEELSNQISNCGWTHQGKKSMNKSGNSIAGEQKAPAKQTIQQKPSLLARLKRKLSWGKKKKKDIEIYPLF
jgi:hypothetical protein